MSFVAILFLGGFLFIIGFATSLFWNFKGVDKIFSLLQIATIIFGIFLLLTGFLLFDSIKVLKSVGVDEYTKLGPYGDYIGGMLNPLIAFFAIVAAGFAFFAQYQANKQVQDQFKIQQFESQFYEMLRLHSSNVSEMSITNNISGRKTFVRMFYEFKFIYLSLHLLYEAHKNIYDWNYDKEKLSDLAYKTFFFGIGSVSNRILFQLTVEEDRALLTLLIEYLSLFQKQWQQQSEDYLLRAVPNEEDNSIFEFEMFYYPFDGNSTRLGHYYRHLFQTVSFIVESNVIVKREEKNKYLKLLRAQLSNHEQLLLYYNSLTKFGSGWIENKYFTNYKMIKNIPTELADFGKIPSDKLGLVNDFGEKIFEWDE